MAVVASVGLAVTAYAGLHTVRGQRLDQAAMEAVTAGTEGLRKVLAVLGTVSLWSIGAAVLACLAVALVRGRAAAAVGALVLVAGADGSTQVLKHAVFERSPDVTSLPPSLPSGHGTVALSLGLAAVLVTTGRARALVVPLAAASGTLVGAGTVVGAWHRPADVLAAAMVCLAWTAVGLGVVAVLSPSAGSRATGRAGVGVVVTAFLGASAVGVLLLAWGVRPGNGWADLPLVAAALGSIGVTVAVVVAWTAGVANRHGL